MNTIEALERTYDYAGKLISGITPEQLTLPTPCTEWDLRTLLNHMVGAMHMFAQAATGGADTDPDVGELVGDDPATAFAAAARANLAAWRTPGVLEREVVTPLGAMPGDVAARLNSEETLTHAWDVAKATGQDATLDPEVAAMGYELCQHFPLDEIRASGALGPAVPVPDDAPVADRLIGLMGRHP